ncbi:MAG: c-type cytochrome [Gemmatimonadetes bacterium]|nr:c-type cytochrome [Gemmatimonadota bacterium]
MKLTLPAYALVLLLAACGGDAPESAVSGAGSAMPAVDPLAPGVGTALGAVPIPATNPMTEAKIALGQQLFFEPRMSVDGSRSCYSCHLNEDGNGGHDPKAIGAQERQLTRHAPVIWNVGYMPRLYWDGRTNDLEAQARAAWGGGNMGVGADNLDAKATEIGQIPGYATQFAAVFGARGATGETVSEAIAAYERTLVCSTTRFDRYQAGETAALNEQEGRGMGVFNGKGGCVACHMAPFFSSQVVNPDEAFYNVGIGIDGVAEASVDIGRQTVSQNAVDWAAFKVPSLRNVARSAPYFHDGSVGTLVEAVRFMASGGYPNKSLTALLANRALTDAEIADVVAFLGSLDCGSLAQPQLPN